MYLFSIPRTKPNGMDDVKLNELSEGTPIIAYKKFFGNKIYKWEHLNGDVYRVFFRVKDITLCYGGGYRVWCEILTLNYNGEQKIDSSKMGLLQSYFKRTLSGDFGICSIDNVDIVIYNREQYEIKLKKSLHSINGGYDFYRNSITSYPSYRTIDNRDDLVMSYEMALGINRRR